MLRYSVFSRSNNRRSALINKSFFLWREYMTMDVQTNDVECTYMRKSVNRTKEHIFLTLHTSMEL
jgi:hypothetical protein